MNRRDFIAKGCVACLSATALASLLTSCQSTRYISGRLGENGLILSPNDFKIDQQSNTAYRSFIIIRNDSLQYPICVYRFSDTDYSAIWMKCAHQGAELQASGDTLQCPAHGSEFNNKGKVTNGPASTDLRTFPVSLINNEIFIDLRKK